MLFLQHSAGFYDGINVFTFLYKLIDILYFYHGSLDVVQLNCHLVHQYIILRNMFCHVLLLQQSHSRVKSILISS